MSKEVSQIPIIQSSYQLSLMTQTAVASFPKNLRYPFGDRVATLALDTFEGILKANTIKGPLQKADSLDNLSNIIFSLRMYMRMAKDLKALSLSQYSSINMKIEDVHKQLIAWAKWSKSQNTLDQRDQRPIS